MKEKYIELYGKKLALPMFLPDATKGYVRGVDSNDLDICKVDGIVVNIFHLLNEDLIEKIKQKKGIHNYTNFNDLIISDSGGFQVMSLIRSNPNFGEINDRGAIFTINHKKIFLTPEKCIQMQIEIGSNIVMCLDDCTYPDMNNAEQEKSVERTIQWAKRCKEEFTRQIKFTKPLTKPLIFGIIQGGYNLDLRKKCAEKLIEIGFDGYAFGGWPVKDNKFLNDLLEYTCKLMPNDKLKYAMGVGKPEDIFTCVEMGYDLFDCVIPTREARNNRLYVFKRGLFGLKKLDRQGSFYDYVRIRSVSSLKDKNPISKYCDCYACKNYSKSQLYHFFKEKNPESVRLATIHNLRFYTRLMERLRK